MKAIERFVLFVKGKRAAAMQKDDDDIYRPWWADDEEDPSFKVIRAEARQRASDDLREAMAAADARPKKRLGVITTGMIGNPKPGPSKEAEPEVEKETLREKWRRLKAELERLKR